MLFEVSMKHSPAHSFLKLNTQQLTLIGLTTAVLCVLGPLAITIPVSPVPLSLGTLGIYFVVTVLGTKPGVLSILLYLMLGFAGLPIFTGFASGPAKIFGPTGGYLLGYLFLAVICGVSAEKFRDRYALRVLGMCLGTGICYLVGTLWLGYQLSLSFTEAFAIGVLPYLPWDLIKLLVGTAMGTKLRKYLLRANLIC